MAPELRRRTRAGRTRGAGHRDAPQGTRGPGSLGELHQGTRAAQLGPLPGASNIQ
jgi:hypothetical protein